MNKQAVLPWGTIGSALMAALKHPATRSVVGGTIGLGVGRYVTPRIGGYDDVPQAKGISQAVWGTEGALLPYLLAPGAPSWLRYGRLALAPIIGAIAETVPANIAQQHRNTQAVLAQSKATQDMARATESASIPANLKKFMTGDIAKGMGGGAAAAGLAALVTGLARRKNDEEERRGKGRAQMIGSDFLRYALPAMAAGGVIGSLKGPSAPSSPAQA